jgi:sugar lactone lactonase YvrE
MNTRPNDGRVDRHGNFIIGSYNKSHRLDAHAIGGRGLHTSTSQLNLSRF